MTLAIRPQHLDLTQDPDQDSQSPEGTIKSKTYLGDSVLFEVELSGVTLTVKLPGDSSFSVGQRATVVLPEDNWHIYS